MHKQVNRDYVDSFRFDVYKVQVSDTANIACLIQPAVRHISIV